MDVPEELELKANVKPKAFQEIGRLLALRDQLVRDRSGLKSTLKEQRHLLKPINRCCCKILERSIKHIDKQVLSIEKHMKELLETDDRLQQNYRLLLSIKGVGLILSCQLLLPYPQTLWSLTTGVHFRYCVDSALEYSSEVPLEGVNKATT